MKISEISSRVAQGTIRINDVPVAARAISSDEDEFLRKLLPQPTPTKEKPKPVRGAVVMAPDTNDPEYRRAITAWAVRFACLELAVACDMETEGGLVFTTRWIGAAAGGPDDAEAKLWRDAVVKELAGTLSRAVIDGAIDELRALEAGAVARAYAAMLGVDASDLDEHETRRCRINVSAGANTLPLAAQLATRYKIPDLAGWWDAMPIGQRAMVVAHELFLTREE